jgi:aryl-alcohol dehydrogenase-like predicted oxidoreductase
MLGCMTATSPSLDAWIARRGASPAALALGTMNFGRRTDEAESMRILDRAVERGITLLDTADVYTDGASERIVGRFLAKKRDRVLVATKVGLARKGGKREGLSPKAIGAALDASLSRLGTDHVDLYYLHAPDPDTPIEETLDAVAEEIARGRVRRLALSNYAAWQILETAPLCLARGFDPPRVTQTLYNLLARSMEAELAPFARKYGVHVTVYNALAGGLLAASRGAHVAKGARFQNPLYARRYGSARLAELAEAYRALAEKAGVSLLELAYGFLAASPDVDSILLGPASVAHLDAALDACARPLSADVLADARSMHEALTGTNASHVR